MIEDIDINIVRTVGGFFTVLSCLISGYLIIMHHMHYTKPNIQSKIVGILWMTPIYVIDSFLSLNFISQAVYIDFFRDCYESYVIYLFFALLLSYLGCNSDDNDDDDLFSVEAYLETSPQMYCLYPFNLCFTQPLPRGRYFLRYIKFGLMQYTIVKLLTTFFAVIATALGVYHQGNYSISSGYLYNTIISNVSCVYALTVLVMFYYALKFRLKPYDVVGKFLSIKFILFFLFWQQLIVDAIIKSDVVITNSVYDSIELSAIIQNVIITVEMSILAIVHIFVFSYKPFAYDSSSSSSSLSYNNNFKYEFLFSDGDSDDINLINDINFNINRNSKKSINSSNKNTSNSSTQSFISNSRKNIGKSSNSKKQVQFADEAAYRAPSTSSFLENNFSISTAIKDFNEAGMPITIPVAFTANSTVIRSNAKDRVSSVSIINSTGSSSSSSRGDDSNL